MKTLILVILMTTGSVARADWEPTFVDNFSGNSLNQSLWAHGKGPTLSVRSSFAVPEALQVKNGNAILSVLDDSLANRAYAGSYISTKSSFVQKYGYFEMRAKMPRGRGLWPAFWLLPKSGRWSHEIDILDYASSQYNELHQGLHFDQKFQPLLTGKIDLGAEDPTSGFNTYGLLWEKNRLVFYFNGKKTHEINNNSLNPAFRDAKIPDVPMYIILNNISGSFFTEWIKRPISSSLIDPEFQVDYVRVFKKVPAGKGQFATIPRPNQSLPNVLKLEVDPATGAPHELVPVSIQGARDLPAGVLRADQYQRLEAGKVHNLKIPLAVQNHGKKRLSGELNIYVSELKNFDKKGFGQVSVDDRVSSESQRFLNLEPGEKRTLVFNVQISSAVSKSYKISADLDVDNIKNIRTADEVISTFEIIQPDKPAKLLNARGDDFTFRYNQAHKNLQINGSVKLLEAWGLDKYRVVFINDKSKAQLYSQTLTRGNNLDAVQITKSINVNTLPLGTDIRLRIVDAAPNSNKVGFDGVIGKVISDTGKVQLSNLYETVLAYDGDNDKTTEFVSYFTCPADLKTRLSARYTLHRQTPGQPVNAANPTFQALPAITRSDLQVVRSGKICKVTSSVNTAYRAEKYKVLTEIFYPNGQGVLNSLLPPRLQEQNVGTGQADRVEVLNKRKVQDYNNTLYQNDRYL